MPLGPEPSSSFCVVPWMDRFVNESGFLKVCCVAEGEENYITNAKGRRVHIQDDVSEADLQNSPRLVALRQAMLNGEWDPICGRCRAAERSGGGSSRTGRNHHLRQYVAEALADTSRDGTIRSPKIRHLDLRLGNYCNLTCRMCTPGASKLWIDSYERMQPAAYRLGESRIAELRRIDWVEDPDVWRRFRQILPDVEWLHFAGGEPMMIPQMIEALRMCIDEGVAGAIHLSYHTNLTLLPEPVRELWPHFKHVTVSASIDAYGRLNEYIRRPSCWSDIDRHLHALDDHFDEMNLLDVHVGTTVQAYNVLDLAPLYEYLRTNFTRIDPLPVLTPLSWPAYLSVQVLPQAVKDLARERLEVEKARAEYQRPRLLWLRQSIDTLIAYMDDGRLDAEWDDFVGFTARSDQEFGDSLASAAPELAALLAARA